VHLQADPQSSFSDPELADSVTEVSLMDLLRHPNIVKILNARYVHGVLNIYMEYVDGGSLAERYARSSNVPEGCLAGLPGSASKRCGISGRSTSSTAI
jgi:serine/threonine protein kinase